MIEYGIRYGNGETYACASKLEAEMWVLQAQGWAKSRQTIRLAHGGQYLDPRARARLQGAHVVQRVVTDWIADA